MAITGLRTIATDTLRAMAFLSRLPVPSRFFNGYDGTLARISGTAPLVGALLALPSALLVGLVQAGGGDALTGALLAVALMVLITGALHEDGLADCADGMGGGRDREHALAIMKDSHIGAYGVVALVLSLALRASALAALCRDLPAPMAGLILIAVAAASRAAMVWHWHALPPARSTGVASGAGRPDGAALRMALVIAAILAGPLCLLAAGPAGLLGAIVACVLATGLFTARVSRRLAGHTGDTIGASQQIAETAMLSALALLA